MNCVYFTKFRVQKLQMQFGVQWVTLYESPVHSFVFNISIYGTISKLSTLTRIVLHMANSIQVHTPHAPTPQTQTGNHGLSSFNLFHARLTRFTSTKDSLLVL